jgi:hypothetical protein
MLRTVEEHVHRGDFAFDSKALAVRRELEGRREDLGEQGARFLGVARQRSAKIAQAAPGTVTVTPSQLSPPNHKFVPVSLSNATDPDGDSVTTSVTQVRQDENPNGEIDAKLTDGELLLRAERDGGGDGRVYHISFTATDSGGASCNGQVTVCVPHDRGKLSCIDQGPVYASGVP